MSMIRNRTSIAGALALMLALVAPGAGAQGAQSPEAVRADLMTRFSLTTPGLELTADQKARIDRVLDAYTAESRRIRGNSGGQMSDRQNAELSEVRAATSQQIGAVLNEDQRRVWNAAVAQRRAGGGAGASRSAAGASRSASPGASSGRSSPGASSGRSSGSSGSSNRTRGPR